MALGRNRRTCAGRALTAFLLGTAVLLLFVAPAALADVRTLDFEALPAGFPVGDQYNDGTLGAVQFDYDTTGFHYTGDFATYVSDWGSSASSGTHVAVLPYDKPPAARDRGRARVAPSAGDRRRARAASGFGYSTSWLAFAYTHTFVSMNVGFKYAVSGPPITFTLYAFDANGQQITSQSVSVPQDGQVNHPISVSDGLGGIAYVEIDVPAHSAAMDDVSFDIPANPPPPDFGFSWPLRDVAGVSVGPNESRDVSFSVTRVNGSTGNINFSAGNLPPGVTATFSPNPDTAPGRSTVTMHLTASSHPPPTIDRNVTVSASPDASAGSTTRNIVVPVTVLGEYDLRARGLEITQGIQSGGPGEGLPQIQTGPYTYRYNGVKLVAYGYKQTVVRFYADAGGAPPGGVTADAQLYGFDSSGRPLPGSPLNPDVLPSGLIDRGAGTSVTYAERANDQQSFFFTLPPGWLAGQISLRAHVTDQLLLFGRTGRECGGGCSTNNDVTLTDIPFTQESVVSVDPVKIVYDDRTQPGAPRVEPPSPFTPFNTVNKIAPIDVMPHYWRGEIDITTHKEFKGFKGWVTRSFIGNNDIARKDKGSEVLDLIDEWAEDYADVNWPVGILGNFNQFDGSSSDLGISHNGPLFSGSMPSAVVNYQRPYTSVAHELGHNLGRQHASGGCGGGSNGETAQGWPDPFGYIRGVGIDFTRAASDGAPYTVLAGDVGGGNCGNNNPPDCGNPNPAQPFDYMSYCATDSSAWISDIGWNAILGAYHLARERPLASTARVHGLMVRGFMSSDKAQVDTVMPGQFKRVAVDAASTPFKLQALDAAGHVIASTPMQASYTHADQVGAPQPVVFFRGLVPTTSVASIRVIDNGKLIARRDRSAHAPRARLLFPSGGSVVGRQPIVKVRWFAHDADQAAADQRGLDVSLDYSADGGRTFSRIFIGPNTGSVALPRTFFSRSNRARLRINVSDGFNLTTVISRRFRSLGAPPMVHVSNPVPNLQLNQDATLLLRGQAFDDAGRRLTGRSLTWLAGRTVLAHGEITSTSGLAAGLVRITLRAADRYGRTSSDSVRVILIQVVPAFRQLGFPATVSHKARSFTLTIRSSVTTTLRVGSVAYAVGPTMKRLKVAIKPGRSSLRITLRLGTGQLVLVRRIKIARR